MAEGTDGYPENRAVSTSGPTRGHRGGRWVSTRPSGGYINARLKTLFAGLRQDEPLDFQINECARVAGQKNSADFHDERSGCERGNDPRQLDAKQFEERGCSTIADSHPEKFDRILRRGGEEIEILVLAHDDQLMLSGVVPDYGIIYLLQSKLANMLSVVTVALKEVGKRRGQLMINEKRHVAWSTTWSVWCAAYSSAARMSSRSRSG